MNSEDKLKSIVKELQAVQDANSLKNVLKDKQSKLYQAINTPRISSLTFLGAFGVNRSKSLMMIEERFTLTNK